MAIPGPYLGHIVDVGSLVEQQGGDVLVAVVGRDVQRREARLARHVRLVVVLPGGRHRSESKVRVTGQGHRSGSRVSHVAFMSSQ